MKQYIGTKIVQAERAVRVQDNEAVKPFYLTGEDIDDKMQYADVTESGSIKEGYMIQYADGYVSWSPKEVFEEAYRQIDGMNFGLALEACKKGKRISRRGWNGKGQYAFLVNDLEFHTDADLSEFSEEERDVYVWDALAFCGTSGIQVGWLASQADMLADDWFIVDEEED